MAEAVRKRANTRGRLIDAAASLFAETGTTRVSIDEICARAGYTRGAFYSNFSSIDALLFALYERKTEELLETLAASSSDPAPAGGIEAEVARFLEIIPADVQWYVLRSTFGARAQHDGTVAAALRAHGEELRRGLTPFVVDMVCSAGLRLVVDEEEATRVIIAAHVGAVLQGALVDDPTRLRSDTVLAAVRGLTE